MTLIIKIILTILIFVNSAFCFDLSVSVSGGSGEWVNGTYQIDPSATLTFTCAASGGTAPYTYSWDFDHPPKSAALTWRRDWDTDGDSNTGYDEDDEKWLEYSTEQNPSYEFVYPADYLVWVHVKDAIGTVEKSLLKISAPKILNPSAYSIYCAGVSTAACAETRCNNWAGYGSLAGDASTDDTTALDTLLGLTGTKKVIIFPANKEYRFVGQQYDSPYTYWFIADKPGTGLVLQGESNVKLTMDVPYDVNGGECVDGDGACDITSDGGPGLNRERFFFSGLTAGQYLAIKNLHLFRDLNGYTTGDLSGASPVIGNEYGGVLFQNMTITNFDVIGDPGTRHFLISKCNTMDWGNDNRAYDTPSPGSASNWAHGYGYGGIANTLWKNNYIKTSTRSSHVFYLGEGEDYQYVVSNFSDTGTGGIAKQQAFSIFTTTGTIYDQSYKWGLGNYFYKIGDDGIYNRADENPHDLYFYDNTFKQIGGVGANIVNTKDAANANVEVKYNLFETVGDAVFKLGEESAHNLSDLNFTGNFIKGAAGAYWAFTSSDVSGCVGQETSLNPDGCTAVLTTSGNAATDTGTAISDPGVWAYVSPTISSTARNGTATTITATGGSGLTGTRWPHTIGAWMQVVDASGNHSQIKAYSASETTWGMTPATIRVADKDHNVSGPYMLSAGFGLDAAGSHSFTPSAGGPHTLTLQ